MAELVVDALEVIDVEHDEAELAAEAARALELVREGVAEAAHVGEARQLVGERLAACVLVHEGVLHRYCGLGGQVGEQVALAVVERLPVAGD